VTGRFAPSPTGPLHLGSLVAAVGSWLFARHGGGRWLVRVEDLDTARVVPGSADEIVAALRRYALHPDEEPVLQSRRTALYQAALARLHERGLVYDCGCTRAELRRVGSAPAAEELPAVEGEAPVYPGTCRRGLPPGREARAVRFRVPAGAIAFTDRVHGPRAQDVAAAVGDFVVRRADGLFAYQLAVVVDDAAQEVTEVVRGGDLLDSTPRQIALQRALDLPTPAYAHLPLVLGPDGRKLGKRDGALPLPSLDRRRVLDTLRSALRILGVERADGTAAAEVLADALARFDPAAVPRGAQVVAAAPDAV
jgi:glutamyl-Q tRNA(Asp) synthetase